MLPAVTPSLGSAVKLARSSTWKMPEARRSNMRVSSNVEAAVFPPSSTVNGTGTARGEV